MLSPEVELLVRSLLTAKVAETANVGIGISEPDYFRDKTDFAWQNDFLSETATDEANAATLENLLCDFSMTSFVRFDETKNS